MKILKMTLLAAALLSAVLMAGCTRLTEAKNNTPSAAGANDTHAELGEYGVTAGDLAQYTAYAIKRICEA